MESSLLEYSRSRDTGDVQLRALALHRRVVYAYIMTLVGLLEKGQFYNTFTFPRMN